MEGVMGALLLLLLRSGVAKVLLLRSLVGDGGLENAGSEAAVEDVTGREGEVNSFSIGGTTTVGFFIILSFLIACSRDQKAGNFNAYNLIEE